MKEDAYDPFRPLTEGQRAAVKDAVRRAREHPWMPPLRFHKRDPDDNSFVLPGELIYSRWLRVRWERKPVLKKTVSARIWLWRLEIVFDPIPKSYWEKRIPPGEADSDGARVPHLRRRN